MTREEAKTWLNKLYARADITDEYGDMEDMQPYEEAVNMAIKALEQDSKILNTLDFAIDASNGDTNYFVGFRNGLRYDKSLIDGEENPQFEHCAEQEPKTGHWIDIKLYRCYDDGGILTTKLRCSCCNEVVEWDTELLHKPYYCENCGARMIEQKESEEV